MQEENGKKNDSNELRKLLGSILGSENMITDPAMVAAINDARLQKIAEYDLSRGYTDVKITSEQLNAKFAELKNTVLTKSSTLAELETTIFSRWGVLEKPRIDMPKGQMQMPELNDVRFAETRPITGFTQEETSRKVKKPSKKSMKR